MGYKSDQKMEENEINKRKEEHRRQVTKDSNVPKAKRRKIKKRKMEIEGKQERKEGRTGMFSDVINRSPVQSSTHHPYSSPPDQAFPSSIMYRPYPHAVFSINFNLQTLSILSTQRIFKCSYNTGLL